MPYFIAEQDALQYLPHNVTASSEIKDLSVPAMQYSLAKILEKVRTNHYIAQLMRHLEVKYCHLTNADTTPLLADVFFHFEWLVINFRGKNPIICTQLAIDPLTACTILIARNSNLASKSRICGPCAEVWPAS
jgi:hypothetical protein